MKALQPQPATLAEYERAIASPTWVLSKKYDGVRGLWDGTRFCNREGDPLTKPIPAELVQFASALPAGTMLDGEIVGGRYYLFDVPMWEPLGRRLQLVDRVAALAAELDVPVIPVPHLADGKEAAIEQWTAEGCEGFVFKQLSSLYPAAGGKTRRWLKWKLIQTIDVVVIGRGADGKDNFLLGLYQPGATKPVEVGKVSALTGDGPRVQIDDVVEVTVLDVTDADRLLQPVKPILRHDKRPEDCTWDQLDQIRKETKR